MTTIFPFLLHIMYTIIITLLFTYSSAKIISKQQATQKLQSSVKRNRWTTNKGSKSSYTEIFENSFSSPRADRECFEEICSYEESREIFEDVSNVDTNVYSVQITDSFYMPLAHPCEAFEICNDENSAQCVNKYNANLDDIKCVCEGAKDKFTV